MSEKYQKEYAKKYKRICIERDLLLALRNISEIKYFNDKNLVEYHLKKILISNK